MPQKILIADDDQDTVYLLKEVLQKHGYEVLTASDGYQALKIVKANVPDLMIVDLTMPSMSGWQFTVKVRQDERFKTTPIIVLSGLLEGNAEPEKFELVSAYMVKPYDVFKLIDKIKELLKGPSG
ncbi:MAG: response regulator [Candidatus Omnitrophica bacterium]|nr:response regulator [Candidatus Omnitrophota bacterium]